MNDTVQRHLPGTRPGTVLVPQGALVRGPAFLIDTFLASLVAAVILGGQASLAKIVLVTLAVEFVYFAVFEGLLGTTLGKRLFGLRVVRAADGRPCGPLAAVVRTLLRLVDNVLFSLPGIAAIISSPRRQRLGDRAAKTLVVSEVPEQLLKVFAGFPGLTGAGRPAGGGPVVGGTASGTPGSSGGSPAGGPAPDQMLRDLTELARRQGVEIRLAPDGAETIDASRDGEPVTALADVAPCPFCDEPMSVHEIVCRHCDHYVNQVSAHGETDDLAPVPQLYSEDRNHRFDALWRLVFTGDEQSLAAVEAAAPAWPQADRLLAVHAFSEVADPRPLPFLGLMARDPDPAVAALARTVRERLGAGT